MRCARGLGVLLAAGASLVLFGAPPSPPPTPDAAPAAEPAPLTIEKALDRIRAAYASGTTGERLRVTVRASATEGGEPIASERGSTLMVWTRPSAGAASLAARETVVQAGRLIFLLSQDRSAAFLDRASPPWFESSSAGSASGDGAHPAIPPLPVPHADIARWDASGAAVDVTPYARGVSFASVTEDARAGVFALRGGGEHGSEVEIVGDGESGRLRRITIARADRGRRTTIEIAVEPLLATPPPARTLDPARRLDTWNDFVREVRSAGASGAALDPSRLLDLSGRPWAGESDGRGSILVFVPAALESEPESRRTLAEALASLRHMLADREGWSTHLVITGGVGEAGIDEAFLSRVQALLDALRPDTEHDGLAGSLLCVDERWVAEHLEEGSVAAAMIVGPDRSIRRVLQVPRDPAALADFEPALGAALE